MEPGSTLRAKRFFVTGGTGFLGTALIERILRSIPEAEVVALVRPSRRATAAERAAREILRNDCFDRLRAELGDRFSETIAPRLIAVGGDVGEDGLGLDDEGRALLVVERHRDPLGGCRRVRLPARPGRQRQPARPVPRRAAAVAAARAAAGDGEGPPI